MHGVKRTLHAYAEKPLRVRGQKIIMFRKYKNTNRGTEGGDIYVRGSNFPLNSTQEELLDVLEPLGKYERLVIRMSLAFLFREAVLSERTSYRPRVKPRVFHTFERGLCRTSIEFLSRSRGEPPHRS